MNRKQIDTIEQAVSIPAVLALHGVKVSRTRCKCPIHHGSRNSFSFNDKVYHCFTCGSSGGVIQLQASMDGTDDDTACRTLARQFGLNIDSSWTKQDRINYRLEKMIQEDYDAWQNEKAEYYRRLSTLFRNIKDVPELGEMAENLERWLDENIEGVTQQWNYQTIH